MEDGEGGREANDTRRPLGSKTWLVKSLDIHLVI